MYNFHSRTRYFCKVFTLARQIPGVRVVFVCVSMCTIIETDLEPIHPANCMAIVEPELYPILPTAAPYIYLSLAIDARYDLIKKEVPLCRRCTRISLIRSYISMNPTHGSTLPNNKYSACAMPGTLVALSAIFQPFPALCPFEPRLPRGGMKAVPCGARSNTLLLPAFSFQPPAAGIRSVRI